MITHIDVGHVLRRDVCDLYSNLVTRPTGAAVRLGIEQHMADHRERHLTVLDFGSVALLDFSCADEVIAKLVLKYCASDTNEAYFMFTGISESHLDAIESVLERHGIAIVVQEPDGSAATIGPLTDAERRAWETVSTMKRLSARDISQLQLSGYGDVGRLLASLHARRLLMHFDDEYVSLGEIMS